MSVCVKYERHIEYIYRYNQTVNERKVNALIALLFKRDPYTLISLANALDLYKFPHTCSDKSSLYISLSVLNI